MITFEIPTRQQLDQLVKGDERLLRSIASLFEYINFYRNRQIINAKNTSGSRVNKATAVMYTGIDNAGDTPSFRMTFAPADAGSGPRSKFLGISLENTINNQFSNIVNFGEITNIDTSGGSLEAWADGDILYINSSSPGVLTNSEPTAGFIVPIARVLRANATSGSIFVNNSWGEGDG